MTEFEHREELLDQYAMKIAKCRYAECPSKEKKRVETAVDNWLSYLKRKAEREEYHQSEEYQKVLKSKGFSSENLDKQFLNSLFETSKKSSLIASWEGGEDFDWEMFEEDIPNIFHGTYDVEGRNMGWRSLSGELKAVEINGWKDLQKILPQTNEMYIWIYDEGNGKRGMKVSHHDAPTGEFYTFIPVSGEVE